MKLFSSRQAPYIGYYAESDKTSILIIKCKFPFICGIFQPPLNWLCRATMEGYVVYLWITSCLCVIFFFMILSHHPSKATCSLRAMFSSVTTHYTCLYFNQVTSGCSRLTYWDLISTSMARFSRTTARPWSSILAWGMTFCEHSANCSCPGIIFKTNNYFYLPVEHGT